MSVWDALGGIISKVVDYIPGRREAKKNKIAELLEANAKIQAKEGPMSAIDSGTYILNADTIKRLRRELGNQEG
jgi:hypothetical protein